MDKYDSFANYASVKEFLKPICCKSCRDEGMSIGTCSKCMENRAYNREWLETHTFITDDQLRCYHSCEHNYRKTMPLRMPNEHPYLYYGIELEIEFDTNDVCIYDNGDDDDYDEDDNWRINEILEEFSKITNGLFVYEKDSSLSNGVELISPPCSYAFWTDKNTIEMLKKGMEFLKEKGAYKYQPNSNGMHIHISKKFFDHGEGQVQGNMAYEGFDWLFQKFQPELEKLGGREYTNYCQSKKKKAEVRLRNSISTYINDGDMVLEVETKAKLKKGGRLATGHDSAVIQDTYTIEARTFKSTTDYKEILSNIEIVRNFAHAVRETDIKKSLNELLHTKENKFLDEHIQKVRMQCKKNKEELDLEKVNDDEIEVEVTI